MAISLDGKTKDLDGFSVSRILPHAKKRMVGPFIFIDHMGPATFSSGEGIDVRPHPHIGLATITYMLDGSLLHRDSLGNYIEILPGDVNWMTAGKGIVHSERETNEVKGQEHVLNGMQCWMALPEDMAEIDPSFEHIKRCQLPHWIKEGVQIRVVAGEAYGVTSPIRTYSPMFYLDCIAKHDTLVQRPNPNQECMLYVIYGSIEIDGQKYSKGNAILLEDESEFSVLENSRVLMYGGDKWETVPHLFWNFVSFSKKRIEQAKDDWKAGRFPSIPGDDREFTPLPE
jgi:redox-sensitive bicupin YhaK (pirin superfamily)